MSSRPTKRAKTGEHLVAITPSLVKQLAKVSKGGLVDCALGWVINKINPPPSSTDSSQEEQDSDSTDDRSLEDVYGRLRDKDGLTKATVLSRIQRDWVSHHHPRLRTDQHHPTGQH